MSRVEVLTRFTGRFHDAEREAAFVRARQVSPWEHRFNLALVTGIAVAALLYRVTALEREEDRGMWLIISLIYVPLTAVGFIFTAVPSLRERARPVMFLQWCGHNVALLVAVLNGGFPFHSMLSAGIVSLSHVLVSRLDVLPVLLVQLWNTIIIYPTGLWREADEYSGVHS